MSGSGAGSPAGTPVREALDAARDGLRAAGIPDPGTDAEVLLAAVTGCSRAELHLPDRPGLAPAESRAFSEAVRRRLRREPVAYITGRRGFRGIELAVDPRVLIPRPETELLVELARELSPRRVLEVGTGSGAVALAVARELPGATVVATDTSGPALEVASSNARRLRLVDRVSFHHGSLPREGRFDLLLANLPYVAEDDRLPPEVSDWEPGEALFAGPEGLDVIAAVLGDLASSPIETGAIGLEVGAGQAEAVSLLVAGAGFDRIRTIPDLAGHGRVVVGLATDPAD